MWAYRKLLTGTAVPPHPDFSLIFGLWIRTWVSPFLKQAAVSITIIIWIIATVILLLWAEHLIFTQSPSNTQLSLKQSILVQDPTRSLSQSEMYNFLRVRNCKNKSGTLNSGHTNCEKTTYIMQTSLRGNSRGSWLRQLKLWKTPSFPFIPIIQSGQSGGKFQALRAKLAMRERPPVPSLWAGLCGALPLPKAKEHFWQEPKCL